MVPPGKRTRPWEVVEMASASCQIVFISPADGIYDRAKSAIVRGARRRMPTGCGAAASVRVASRLAKARRYVPLQPGNLEKRP